MGTPALPARPRTATPGFSGSTAYVHQSRWSARERDWEQQRSTPRAGPPGPCPFPDLTLQRSASLGALARRAGSGSPMAFEDLLPARNSGSSRPDILQLEDGDEARPLPAGQRSSPELPSAPISPFALHQEPHAKEASPAESEQEEGQPSFSAASYPPLQQHEWQQPGGLSLQPLPSLVLDGRDWQERCRSSNAQATPSHPWQPHLHSPQLQPAGSLARIPSVARVRSGLTSLPPRREAGNADLQQQPGKEVWQHGLLSGFLAACRSSSLHACSAAEADASMEDLPAAVRELSMRSSLSMSQKMEHLVST
jgi:hypothetical protein